MGPGWLDYPTFEAARQEGVLDLRQDVRQLDALIRLGVDGFFALVDEGRLVPPGRSTVVCHYSSQFFRTRILELLAKAGAPLPRGEAGSPTSPRADNVGCASVFVLLEELVNERPRSRPGQQIFGMVPESGRFIVSYMMLTAVGDARPRPQRLAAGARRGAAGPPPLAPDRQSRAANGWCVSWRASGSTSRRASTRCPSCAKLESGRFSAATTTSCSSEPAPAGGRGRALDRAGGLTDGRRARFPLRRLFITHARDEHRDFELLERNYDERRRRRRRHPPRGEERRQRGALGLDVSPREPGEPVRPAGRDVHHRGAGRAAGARAGAR